MWWLLRYIGSSGQSVSFKINKKFFLGQANIYENSSTWEAALFCFLTFLKLVPEACLCYACDHSHVGFFIDFLAKSGMFDKF